ncbi:maf-like protein [Pyrus ussuriensis x Pyrus communis]|uniref:Maf-like protein n=1 Tax=Pyrus ussuriensis x Pyrus communis TaxID=2448454 RepID=A0A5N5GR24_9ROSA|nr:maf-like protein [Pyrus ussuriensis x Pyrus communis]
MSFQIILGSASAARRQILADAILSRLQSEGQLDGEGPATMLITADTVISHCKIFIDFEVVVCEAWNFIKGYSGGQAAVIGSVLETNLKTGKRKGVWRRAEVYFHVIPEEVIDSLMEEGITLNVAGGLMLEHPLISPFVEAVIGTIDTVMGLPTELTEKLIQEAV